MELLPESYCTVVDAVERYLDFFGPGKGDSLLPMLEKLAGRFEQAAVPQKPMA